VAIYQFFTGARSMTAVTWQAQLDAAQSEREVISVVRELVARLEHSEIATLPEPCRPPKFFEANDVASYAFFLMRQESSDDPATTALIRKLAAIFSHATIRLSQILARSGEIEDVRQSA